MDIGLKVVLICAGFMAICVVLGMIGKKLAESDPHRQRHILRKPKRLSLRRQPFRLPRTAQPCVFPPTFPAAPPMTPLFDGKKHFPLDFPGIL